MTAEAKSPSPSTPRARGVGALLLSLRTKTAIVSVTFVLTFVSAIGFIILRHERLALTREVELRVLAQARSLATSSERIMLEPDPELTFQKLLREIMARDADIISVVVVDKDNIILAHPQVTKIGSPYVSRPGLLPVRDPKILMTGESIDEGEDIFIVSAPITRTYEGEILNAGRVYIASSKGKIAKAIGSARQQVVTIAIIVSLLGSIVAVILAGFVTTPVKKLAEGARRIGEGDFNVRVNVSGRDEIGMLSATLNEMAYRLSSARADLVEKERMAKELEIARDIQKSLLPQSFPDIESLQVAAVCESATEVGGDYFDLIPIDRRRLGIVMADVAGKGVPGLLVMGVARSVIRGQARQHLSPREVLIRANDIITPDIHRGMFVTVLYGVLDVERRSFVVANAGHNPLVVIREQGPQICEVLKTQGRPVGFMVGPFFDDRLEESSILLNDNDVIFTYTDGILDALNAEGEEFGMNRMLGALEEKRGAPPQEIIDYVRAVLGEFVGSSPQHDDITMLALSLQKAAAHHELPPAHEEDARGAEAAAPET